MATKVIWQLTDEIFTGIWVILLKYKIKRPSLDYSFCLLNHPPPTHTHTHTHPTQASCETSLSIQTSLNYEYRWPCQFKPHLNGHSLAATIVGE